MTEEAAGGGLTMQVDGFDEAIRLLSGETLVRVAKAALMRIAEEIKLQAIPYPAEGSWNQPGPYPARWYQRGFGGRWALKDGGVGGNASSEQMQQQWLVNQKGPWQVAVGNRASYSPYVMGAEQRPYHAAHGWRKLEDVAAEVAKMAPDVVREEISKEIGGA